ncbi:MAG TPA: quercetin 2,3-dioxygenase [Nocardioides sp.]|nr:quercetin 2,3-dioxygenase [Nocardioides sp.]
MTMPSSGQHLAADDGDAWWFLDTRMTVKADSQRTGGLYTMIEFSAPQGFGPPQHVHRDEDEAFLILEGGMRVVCGDETWQAEPGSFVFLPRGVPHSFIVTEGPAVRGWQLTTPAGFEKFVAALGEPAPGPGLPQPTEPDVPTLARISAEHGYDIVGPPLNLDDLRR